MRTFLDDFSLVEATMNLLEEALSRNYVYYCLLSGQDYPIKVLNTYMINLLVRIQ